MKLFVVHSYSYMGSSGITHTIVDYPVERMELDEQAVKAIECLVESKNAGFYYGHNVHLLDVQRFPMELRRL